MAAADPFTPTGATGFVVSPSAPGTTTSSHLVSPGDAVHMSGTLSDKPRSAPATVAGSGAPAETLREERPTLTTGIGSHVSLAEAADAVFARFAGRPENSVWARI